MEEDQLVAARVAWQSQQPPAGAEKWKAMGQKDEGFCYPQSGMLIKTKVGGKASQSTTTEACTPRNTRRQHRVLVREAKATLRESSPNPASYAQNLLKSTSLLAAPTRGDFPSPGS